MRLGGRVNLVICQKSKIDDWVEHFRNNYPFIFGNVPAIITHDLTDAQALDTFVLYAKSLDEMCVEIGVINYDLIFRRPELLKLHYDTIMLDESSMIQHENAKRTKAILKLKTDNVILLSGTPTSGRYENLLPQLHLLGWNISKTQYYAEFIETRKIKVDNSGFKIPIVTGYKNVGRLKRKMRSFGCNFLKTDDVLDLPTQTFTDIKIKPSKDYRKFKKDKFVELPFGPCGDVRALVGDTVLTKMLYERQLCGQYNADKLDAFADLLESTNDRLIVFYNFNDERARLKDICAAAKRPISEVNGHVKDLNAYEQHDNSVTLIQYQAGAKGLNLQLANKLIYFSPTLSAENYMQSIKRIHRIGQSKPCFYYRLIVENSIERRIYDALEMRADFTEALFLKG